MAGYQGGMQYNQGWLILPPEGTKCMRAVNKPEVILHTAEVPWVNYLVA